MAIKRYIEYSWAKIPIVLAFHLRPNFPRKKIEKSPEVFTKKTRVIINIYAEGGTLPQVSTSAYISYSAFIWAWVGNYFIITLFYIHSFKLVNSKKIRIIKDYREI